MPENTPLWCIYVPRWAHDNFVAGRRDGYWGSRYQSAYDELLPGEMVLFAHDIASDLRLAPRGFPRTKGIDEFRGTVRIMILGVTGDRYIERDLIPPNGPYAYRFRYNERAQAHDVVFNSDAFPRAVVWATRQSAIAQGRAFCVDPWLLSEPAKE